MSNPVDELLEDEKVAGFGSAAGKAWQELPGHMMGALGMAGAAAITGGVVAATSHIYDAATKSHDFQAMLHHNPDLAEHPSPQHVEMAFTTLRSFAPAFSKDPLVAGTYVRQIAESPANAGGLILPAMQAMGPRVMNMHDMAQQGALQGLKFKDPKDLMAKDLEHQTAVEKMRSGLQKERDDIGHQRDVGMEAFRHQNAKRIADERNAIQLQTMRGRGNHTP